MPKLRVLSAKQVCRILERHGPADLLKMQSLVLIRSRFQSQIRAISSNCHALFPCDTLCSPSISEFESE